MSTKERALELLERHITNGRQAGDAPEATARECLAAMEGLGYRITAAQPAPDHRHGGASPEAARAAVDLLKERCAEGTAKIRGNDPPGNAA